MSDHPFADTGDSILAPTGNRSLSPADQSSLSRARTIFLTITPSIGPTKKLTKTMLATTLPCHKPPTPSNATNAAPYTGHATMAPVIPAPTLDRLAHLRHTPRTVPPTMAPNQ